MSQWQNGKETVLCAKADLPAEETLTYNTHVPLKIGTRKQAQLENVIIDTNSIDR
jgi:hypothetical protein